MARESLYLHLNADSLSNSRVISQTNSTQKPFQKFVVADNRDLNLYFTDGSGSYVDVSSYSSVRVGVGGINKRPTGGTWQFTHGGNDTDLDYNISASHL